MALMLGTRACSFFVCFLSWCHWPSACVMLLRFTFDNICALNFSLVSCDIPLAVSTTFALVVAGLLFSGAIVAYELTHYLPSLLS
uniref:Uncharacterized protein n=1 Tax=Oryza brachyantha TaxID=4533 RepID=J3NC65_ORYBR